jgi:LmbE family N-acetylglucosaminyl deacetylase
MLSLMNVQSLVVIGAHPDDAEVAAGGLMLALARANPGLRVHDVVLTGSPRRHAEARAAAASFLPGAEVTFTFRHLSDDRLRTHWDDVNDHLHAAAGVLDADLVLSPWEHDAHPDHRLVGELVPTVFRNAMILRYEIAQWNGDLGRPNLYVPMSDELAREKVGLLNASFPSQRGREWWDDEVFLGLARLRGVECHSRYAEAFHSTKTVVSLGQARRSGA